jgi:hypothetical protein
MPARTGVLIRPLVLVLPALLAAGAAPARFTGVRQDAPAVGAATAVVDLIVLDNAGRPLLGLGAADFRVNIDGVERAVVAARPLLRIRTRTPSPLGDDRSRDRLVLVVVDEASITRGNERDAVGAAGRLLDRIALDERVALVRLPPTTNQLVLAANGPALRNAARMVVGRMPPAGFGAAAEAAPTLNDDADATDERGNARPAGAPARVPQSASERAGDLEALSARVRQASAGTLHELVRVLEPLKALPGPKTVFFLSAGVATDAATLRAVAGAAAAARAQVDVVQLQPATWQREVFASQTADAPAEEPRTQAPPARLEQTAGLPALASAGGGVFIPAGRKIEEQIDRLLPQVAAGYVLELEPRESDRARAPHQLAISLIRPGPERVHAVRAWAPAAAAAPPTPAARAPVPGPARPAPAPPAAAPIRDPELGRVLDSLGGTLTGYVHDLSSIVAEERYQQTLYRGVREDKVRVLRSDFLLLHTQDGAGWTPFRDVFEVDGKPVRDREERLKRLFLDKPDTALQEALRIKEESVRYLLGDDNTRSNVNWPTLALEFLLPANQWRFEMRRRGEEKVADLAAWRIDYVETATPTLIQTYDRSNVPARGTFWIDPATGGVLKTTLQTGSRTSIEMTITVVYRPNEGLGLLVPAEMREQFATRLGVLLEGRATYGNFRRFQVSTSEQVKVPK